MLKRIVHQCSKLLMFIGLLQLNLSKPQRQHVQRLTDALIVCEAPHKTLSALYALYVEERAGLFVGTEVREANEEGIATLRFASKAAQRQGFELIPVWTVSYNAAEAIARAACNIAMSVKLA